MAAAIGDTVLACKGSDGSIWLVEGSGNAVLALDQTGLDVALLLTGQYLTCSGLSFDANDLFVLIVGSPTVVNQVSFLVSAGSNAASMIVLTDVLQDNMSGSILPGDAKVSLTRDKVCYTFVSSGSTVYMGRNGDGFTSASNGICSSSAQTVLSVAGCPTIADPWHGLLSRWGAWSFGASSSALGANISAAMAASHLRLSSISAGRAFVLIEGDSQAQSVGAAATADDWISAMLSSLSGSGVDVTQVVTEDLGVLSSVVGTNGDTRTDNSCFARISYTIAELNAGIAAGCASATLLLQVGENDVAFAGATVSSLTSSISAYAAAVRAALVNPSAVPFHVVWATVPPRADDTSSGYESVRAAVNALSTVSGVDALVPIGANATIGVVSAVSNTELYADGIHWATGSAGVAGPLYAAVVRPFLITAAAPGPYAWFVLEPDGGSIDSSGNYTAPEIAGTYHIVAVSNADPTQVGVSTVVVS